MTHRSLDSPYASHFAVFQRPCAMIPCVGARPCVAPCLRDPNGRRNRTPGPRPTARGRARYRPVRGAVPAHLAGAARSVNRPQLWVNAPRRESKRYSPLITLQVEACRKWAGSGGPDHCPKPCAKLRARIRSIDCLRGTRGPGWLAVPVLTGSLHSTGSCGGTGLSSW